MRLDAARSVGTSVPSHEIILLCSSWVEKEQEFLSEVMRITNSETIEVNSP